MTVLPTEPRFLQYYDLESYLFDTVRQRFRDDGFLSAFDFFCIVVWKANRSKSRIARRLRQRGHRDLEEAARAVTSDVARQPTHEARLRVLVKTWGFHLPMASAILTVLYPDYFTVYDARVCEALGGFHRLGNLVNFDKLWQGYEGFRQAVHQSAPPDLSLRDKDRYLWGRSFAEQLRMDIARGFERNG